MQYSPDTVIVHSAFLLAERQLQVRSRSLKDLTKEDCCAAKVDFDAVFVVTEAIRETTWFLEYTVTLAKPISSEVEALHYKLNAWIFKAWENKFEKLFPGEVFSQQRKKRNDYFSIFPPLPQFSTAFYLALVKGLDWTRILIEVLLICAENCLSELLEDITNTLISNPDEKDLDIFILIFDTFTGFKNDSQKLLSAGSIANCNNWNCGFDNILFQSLISVKSYITDVVKQEKVIKTLIKCVISHVFGVNSNHFDNLFRESCTLSDETASGTCMSELDDGFSMTDVFKNDELFSHIEAKSSDELSQIIEFLQNNSEMKHSSKNIFSPARQGTLPEEVVNCLKILSEIFIHGDWEICCVFSQENESVTSSDNMVMWSTKHNAYQRLHRWLVGLLGTLLVIIIDTKEICGSENDDSENRSKLPAAITTKRTDDVNGLQTTTELTLQSMVESLHNNIWPCIQASLSTGEKQWTSKLEEGELVTLENLFCSDVQHGSKKGTVEELQYHEEDVEEKLRIISWRISEKLEGYEECFDWLLSAEELYGHPAWLDSIKTFSATIADKAQLLKMIDVLCVLQEISASQDVEELIRAFSSVKLAVLEVFPTLSILEQEEIIEYSYSMLRLQGKEEIGVQSVFFQPMNRQRDTSDFQQQLVRTLNRIVDSSNKKEFHSNVIEISKLVLVCPCLTISKLVKEAVLNSGHTKLVFKILQQLSNTCRLYFSSRQRETLLCYAVKTASSSGMTQQEEKNFLQFLAVVLKPFKPPGLPEAMMQQQPLLQIQELVEKCILPHLHFHADKTGISRVLAVKILGIVLTTVTEENELVNLRRYMIPLLFSLCELLYRCSFSWGDSSPDISMANLQDERMLVLEVLEKSLVLACDLVKMCPSFTRAVEWLLKRTEELDWTVTLSLYPLYRFCSIISYTFGIPDNLLDMCELSATRWHPIASGCGPDSTLVNFFECCRSSDLIVEEFSAALIGEKWKKLPHKNEKLPRALVQVLPHSTEAEWRRILVSCRDLLAQMNAVLEEADEVFLQLCPSSSVDNTTFKRLEIAKISRILVKVMKTLSAPPYASWATPPIWNHVTKQYVTTVKSLYDERPRDSCSTLAMEMFTMSVLFVHVCEVMTQTSAGVDQLFVLALDLVNTVPAVTSCTKDQFEAVLKQLREAVEKIPHQVYREALLQTLT